MIAVPGITVAEALFAMAQIGRALRGEPLWWRDWEWLDS